MIASETGISLTKVSAFLKATFLFLPGLTVCLRNLYKRKIFDWSD